MGGEQSNHMDPPLWHTEPPSPNVNLPVGQGWQPGLRLAAVPPTEVVLMGQGSQTVLVAFVTP